MAQRIKKENVLAALELLGFDTGKYRQPQSRIYFSKMLTETVRLEVEFTMLELRADGDFYFCHREGDATHFRIPDYPSKWSSLYGKGCRASAIWEERDQLYYEMLALCGTQPEPEREDVLIIVD